MRHSFLRLIPTLLSCAAVACAGGDDEPINTTADSAPNDTGAEVAVDSSTEDTTVPMDSGSADTEVPDASETGDDVAKPAVCGNGVLEEGEECDDNNLFKDDGCSPKCKFETLGAGDVCPGIATALTLGTDGKRTAFITGDTSKAYNHYGFLCGGGAGNDLVYAVTSTVSGNVRMKLDATFPAVLGVRSKCADESSELSCGTRVEAGMTSAYVPLLAGETIYVFVDGAGGSAGTFTLSLEQTASYCGDGIAESPETCDDGNTASSDGCSSKCALESTPSPDSCPGPTYSFKGTGTTPRKISIAGDLTGAKNDLSTNICTGLLGIDHVYQLVPDMTGSLSVELRANYLNSGMYLRRECGTVNDSRYDLSCGTSKTLTPSRLTAPVTKGVPVWLVIDSGIGSVGGTYSFDATLTAGSCGNGILDGGEQCDDGNTTDGDGCKSDCTVEAAVGGDKCADAIALTLASNTDGSYSKKFTGSTVGLNNDFIKLGCEWSGNNASPDIVYKVTAPIDGLLSAKLDPNFPAQVAIRAACVETVLGTAADCKAWNATGPVTQTMPVVAGTTYYVIVDSPQLATGAPLAGSFNLDVSVKPGTCGNGILEGAETCDDANTTAGDGCDATCKLETPGPGVSCANPKIVTAVDDGTGVYKSTTSFGTTNMSALKSFAIACPSLGKEAWFKVTAPVTGNMVAEVKNATFDVTLGARSSCSPDTGDANRLACSASIKGLGDERFGIPVVAGTSYYLVVDGSTATDQGRFDLNVTFATPRCGDLVVNTGEECDDGNTTNGDGCDSTCKAEPITGVDTCPGAPITLTGTGSNPRTATVKFSTATLNADYVSTCGGNSRDGVFLVTPDVSGELEIQLAASFNSNLYARSDCTKVLSEYGCAYSNDSTTGTRLLRFPVSAKAPIYVIVDGRDGESGFATLSVKLTP